MNHLSTETRGAFLLPQIFPDNYAMSALMLYRWGLTQGEGHSHASVGSMGAAGLQFCGDWLDSLMI